MILTLSIKNWTNVEAVPSLQRGTLMKLSFMIKGAFVILAMALPGVASGTGTATLPHVPECQGGRPDVFQEIRAPLSLSALPSAVLIARTADVWIENKESGLKIWARHNFKTGQKSFVCASIPTAAATHTSVPLVVLYDRTAAAKVGDSLWQFQIMVRDRKMGLWNQKTGIMTVKDLLNLDSQTRNPQWKVEFESTLLDEPTLRGAQSSGAVESISVIRYDLKH